VPDCRYAGSANLPTRPFPQAGVNVIRDIDGHDPDRDGRAGFRLGRPVLLPKHSVDARCDFKQGAERQDGPW
jgi:hypothetical protein